MSVRDTSAQAFFDFRDEGKIPPQQLKILTACKPGRDYSRSEIAMATGLRLASVCGRIKEMIASGLLGEAPIRECKVTGRNIHPVFKVKPNPE